jgi:hypothetical protein
MDALVKHGVLPTDTHQSVRSMTDGFKFGRGEGVAVHFSCWDALPEMDSTSVDVGRFPHRLPDLNELLAARELGARRSQHGRRPR